VGARLFVADVDDAYAFGAAACEDGVDVSAHDAEQVVDTVSLHDPCSQGAA
jgi:hypothetical protein